MDTRKLPPPAKGKPLPHAFAPLNRLYLPEYKSKQELASGLEEAVQLMLQGKTDRDTHATPQGDALLEQLGKLSETQLLSKRVEAPQNHMFTIFE